MPHRILIAALASPGFVFSSLAVAERARAAGHEVAFVTDVSYADAVEARGFARIRRGSSDGPSFGLDGWGRPLQIAMQFRHTEVALAEFRPDVILATHLALGPLLARRVHGVPLAVLGPLVYLWPRARPHADADAERRLRWRLDDMTRHLEAAAALLELPRLAGDADRTPLHGDRFLLQGVPELDPDPGALPAVCRFAGACATDAIDPLAPTDAAWLDAQHRRGRPVLYVQLGRVFEHPSRWRALRDWASMRDVAAVVCSERHDRALDDAPQNVLVRARVSQAEVLARAAAVVCTGHPTAVLGALTHGLPLVVAPAGSGTEEVADACAQAGAAIVAAGDDAFAAALDRVLTDAAAARAARTLQRRFAAYDGPENVCRALEELAAVRAFARAAP